MSVGTHWACQQKEQELRIENKRLRQALKDIANVLGTGTCTQPNCPGCHYEMEEAATYAREALAEP